MGLIGKQFGMPSGVLGHVAARFMARNNRDFNQQLAKMVASISPPPGVVAELGFGPGVGLAALLDAFPEAQVLGADPCTRTKPAYASAFRPTQPEPRKDR